MKFIQNTEKKYVFGVNLRCLKKNADFVTITNER